MRTIPICTHCLRKWPGFEGDIKDIPPELEAEIKAHARECDKNPLVIGIKELKANARGLELSLQEMYNVFSRRKKNLFSQRSACDRAKKALEDFTK